MNNVSPFIREQINKLSQPGEEASRYAVCYMWGTAGILYNRDTFPIPTLSPGNVFGIRNMQERF